MGRCFGYTKNFNRCQRNVDRFFCEEHSKQPVVFMIFVLGLIGTWASIQSAWWDNDSKLESLYVKGLSYLESSQDEEAMHIFKEIFDIKPDYPTIAYNYGTLLYKSKDYKSATYALEAVPSNEYHSDTAFLKAWAYYNLANNLKAKDNINQFLDTIDINDEKFYYAKALSAAIGYKIFKNDDYYSVVENFYNEIFDILEIESSSKKTSKTEIPGWVVFDFINKQVILRSSAVFVLLNAIEIQFEKENYETVLNLFQKVVKCNSTPWSKGIATTELDYLKMLDLVCVSLYNVKVVYKYDCQDIFNALNVLQNNNKNTYYRLSEIAFILKTIYFNNNGMQPQRVTNGFYSLEYNINYNFDQKIYRIKIDNPEWLGGESVFFIDGVYKYKTTYKKTISTNKPIETPHTYFSACNIKNMCSEPLRIYPVLRFNFKHESIRPKQPATMEMQLQITVKGKL